MSSIKASPRVLISQRDSTASAEIAATLTSAGYQCTIAAAGHDIRAQALTRSWEVVILDVRACHGREDVCAEIRATRNRTAVVFVSSASEPSARVAALRSGADDFISRPYDKEELVLRIQGILRRIGRAAAAAIWRVGACEINLENGNGTRGSQPIQLSPKALRLLHYLHHRRGQIVSQEELLRHVWFYLSSTTRTVDVHVSVLRRLVESDPRKPNDLITVRGRGYMLK